MFLSMQEVGCVRDANYNSSANIPVREMLVRRLGKLPAKRRFRVCKYFSRVWMNKFDGEWCCIFQLAAHHPDECAAVGW